MTAVDTATSWRDDAACKDDPTPDRWFVSPANRQGTEAAKAVCKRCPVAADCLRYALADPSLTGIWGMTTDNQRGRMRKGTPRPLPPIRHGTEGGERAHRRRGEKPCRPCQDAANLAARLRETDRKAAS